MHNLFYFIYTQRSFVLYICECCIMPKAGAASLSCVCPSQTNLYSRLPKKYIYLYINWYVFGLVPIHFVIPSQFVKGLSSDINNICIFCCIVSHKNTKAKRKSQELHTFWNPSAWRLDKCRSWDFQPIKWMTKVSRHGTWFVINKPVESKSLVTWAAAH